MVFFVFSDHVGIVFEFECQSEILHVNRPLYGCERLSERTVAFKPAFMALAAAAGQEVACTVYSGSPLSFGSLLSAVLFWNFNQFRHQ